MKSSEIVCPHFFGRHDMKSKDVLPTIPEMLVWHGSMYGRSSWEWPDEEIGHLWEEQDSLPKHVLPNILNNQKLRCHKSKDSGLNQIPMARYGLILKQGRAMWFRIISWSVLIPLHVPNGWKISTSKQHFSLTSPLYCWMLLEYCTVLVQASVTRNCKLWHVVVTSRTQQSCCLCCGRAGGNGRDSLSQNTFQLR